MKPVLEEELKRFAPLIRKHAREDEDVAQACRLAVWREVRKYDGTRSFEYGVMMRMKQYASRARHRIFNVVSVPIRKAGFEGNWSPTDITELTDTRATCADAVEVLHWVRSQPKRTRFILERRLQDATWDEIGEELGLSRETVRKEAKEAFKKTYR
jgi:RNA polymerase sigma factor (sigma-70 family)